MAETAGLVRLCLIAARSPAVPLLRCATSNRVLIPRPLRESFDLAAPNGGDGGIRTRGALLRLTSLAKKRFRPLSHVSYICKLVDLYQRNQLKIDKIIFGLLLMG